jgi:pilus assembly protein Flp/PilA
MARFIQFLGDTEGATAVEYAVMLALIIGVVIGAISTLGGNTGSLWGGTNTSLTAAGVGS